MRLVAQKMNQAHSRRTGDIGVDRARRKDTMEDENLQPTVDNGPAGNAESGSTPDEKTTDTQTHDSSSDNKDEYVKREVYESVQTALGKEREEKKRMREYYAQRSQPTDTNVEPDEEGNIDPNQIISAAEQRVTRRFEAQLADRDEWAQAVKKFPELDDDPDMEAAIKGYKTTILLSGDFVTYGQAAERVLGKLKKATTAARDEGRREAQVSETVQERAAVTQPTNQTDKSKGDLDELRKLMRHPDKRVADKARVKYLSLVYPGSS